MKVYFHLNLGGFSNCYIVVNEKTSEAIIIDPGKITEEKIKIEEYENSYIVKEFVNNSKLCIILKYNSVSNSLSIEKIIITKKYHLKVYLRKIESFDIHDMCNDILVSPRDKNVLEEYNIIFNKLEKIVDSNFYNKQNLINNILDSIYSENEKVYNNL